MTDYSKTPLNQLSWTEAAKIYQAFHEGRKLQYWSGNWINPGTSIYPSFIYRIAPAEPVVPQEVWDVIGPEWNHMVKTGSLRIWLYRDKPDFYGSGFWNPHFEYRDITGVFPGVDFTGVEPENSLVSRPGFDGGIVG